MPSCHVWHRRHVGNCQVVGFIAAHPTWKILHIAARCIFYRAFGILVTPLDTTLIHACKHLAAGSTAVATLVKNIVAVIADKFAGPVVAVECVNHKIVCRKQDKPQITPMSEFQLKTDPNARMSGPCTLIDDYNELRELRRENKALKAELAALKAKPASSSYTPSSPSYTNPSSSHSLTLPSYSPTSPSYTSTSVAMGYYSKGALWQHAL